MTNSNIFSILIILITIMGCNKSTKDTEKKWILIEDGACYMETQRAKQDVEKGILVYSMYKFEEDDQKEKLKKALHEFNIDYLPLGENCLGDSNCYGKYMLSIITEKHGSNFIDSLKIALNDSSIARP